MKKKRDFLKRGISPVIATVLLISMVIVIALIIFLWVREIGGETITKFGKENVEVACGDVEFSAEYSGGEISVSNTGIVPIYNFKIKVSTGDSYKTDDMFNFTTWPSTGLGQEQHLEHRVQIMQVPQSF